MIPPANTTSNSRRKIIFKVIIGEIINSPTERSKEWTRSTVANANELAAAQCQGGLDVHWASLLLHSFNDFIF